MEEVYPRQRHSDLPGVILRQAERGRAVYFPWDIDRTFWEVLNPDLGRLLGNAVLWALGEPPAIRVTGPGMLDITAWQQERSLTIHLVNLTNPMAMRGAFREIYPVGPLQVTVRLPSGFEPTGVRMLRAGVAAESDGRDRQLSIFVPRLADFEVIAIDLRPLDQHGQGPSEKLAK
jgi:hypothetical protein